MLPIEYHLQSDLCSGRFLEWLFWLTRNSYQQLTAETTSSLFDQSYWHWYWYSPLSINDNQGSLCHHPQQYMISYIFIIDDMFEYRLEASTCHCQSSYSPTPYTNWRQHSAPAHALYPYDLSVTPACRLTTGRHIAHHLSQIVMTHGQGIQYITSYYDVRNNSFMFINRASPSRVKVSIITEQVTKHLDRASSMQS